MITSPYKPAAGRFLISEPFMSDENFQRTVVLLVEHNEQGSLGFVLNRPLSVPISEVVADLPMAHATVCLGGPVEQNTLHYLHRRGDLTGARRVAEGLYWSGDFEELKGWARQGRIHPDDILFFVGYSGWGAGQLARELERKSWIIAPENGNLIFDTDPETLWRELLQSLGTKYKILSNYPTDPSLN